MNLDAKRRYTGGIDGGRGWKGDVKKMTLEISKLKSMGWKPNLSSNQAVKQTIRDLLNHM